LLDETLLGRIPLEDCGRATRGTCAATEIQSEIERKDPGMRTQRFVLSLAIAVGGGLAGYQPAFSQENRGTFEQQMACTPDVWRLCSDQIPDVNRIVTCLRQNTPQLSNNCRAVFDSNASAQQPAPRAPQQAAPRARPAPPAQPQSAPPRPYDEDDE